MGKKKTVGPITPDDLKKGIKLPSEVFKVFNQLIKEDWDGEESVVRQNEAACRIAKALGISRKQVFDQRLMDVEETYEKAGWDVMYDKPGYNESYEAYWKFRK